ncbi:hypothetical protein N9Y92_03205, partial [Chlamydiales bacterium]|nr:hypothetical protein [Chlamydiales bacterium]
FSIILTKSIIKSGEIDFINGVPIKTLSETKKEFITLVATPDNYKTFTSDYLNQKIQHYSVQDTAYKVDKIFISVDLLIGDYKFLGKHWGTESKGIL